MKPTTLILGAGSSMDYGYPSSAQLIAQITNFAQKQNDTEFLTAIREAKPYSIDAFLRDNPKLRDRGKSYISSVIASAEDPSSYYSIHESKDWYRKLCYSLNDKDFRKLKIVSFNYDRSFEYYLARNYAGRRGVSLTDGYKKLKEVEIIHVHGRLFPTQEELEINPHAFTDTQPIRYGTLKADPGKYVAHCMDYGSRLRTVYENSGMSDDVNELVLSSDVVIFLGFGFHDVNMRIFGIDFSKKQKPGQLYYGTSAGIKPVDLSRIRKNYPIIRLYSENCLSFFENIYNLEDSTVVT